MYLGRTELDAGPSDNARSFCVPSYPVFTRPLADTLACRPVSQEWISSSTSTTNVSEIRDGKLDEDPVWSADGAKIAFTRNRDGDDEIFVMNTDGTGHTNLANNDAVSDTQPNWSPGGIWIVFTSDRAGNAEVYTMEDDGDNPLNRTSNPAFDALPDWQPLKSCSSATTFAERHKEGRGSRQLRSFPISTFGQRGL